MLYLLYGSDTERSRAKRRELRDYFVQKIGMLAVHEVHGDDFAPELFETILRSSMLFNEKHVVVCVRLFENDDAVTFITNNIEILQSTEHLFIMWEESIDTKLLAKLGKYAKKVQEFKILTPKHQALAPNVFAICDALLARDGARAWRVYHALVREGTDPSEVFWRAWWQLKSLLAVARDEKSSGQKPFVVKKAKRALAHYTEAQLEDMLWQCVQMYHEERNSGPELPIEFEKFLLDMVSSRE